MRRQIKLAAIVLFSAVIWTGVVALLAAPPVSAGSNCWRDDCNICCRLSNGAITCTDRACPEG
jgi:hypothetical protein